MLRSLQIENFRMMAANHVALGPMHLLVGQNGTGKTTFLQAIRLLSSVQKEGGVMRALEELAPSFFDLCFDRERPIAFAAELVLLLPDAFEQELPLFRYELELGIRAGGSGRVQVLRESLFLLPGPSSSSAPASETGALGRSTIHDQPPRGWLRLVHKTAEGEDRYRDEVTGDIIPFRLGPNRTALSGVIEDQGRFPRAMAALLFLRECIRSIELSPQTLRKPAPPGKGTVLLEDGGNLPFVARELKDRDGFLYRQWVRQVALAIDGLTDINVIERPEDKNLLIQTHFRGTHGEPVPSWLLSDGTLRVMALSLLTFAAQPEHSLLYLVEEIENGLHPLAMQAVYEAIASPPSGIQVLCSTHSPIFLGHGTLDEVLLFRRTEAGTAQVRRGAEDAELLTWTQRVSLGDLFASGVLS